MARALRQKAARIAAIKISRAELPERPARWSDKLYMLSFIGRGIGHSPGILVMPPLPGRIKDCTVIYVPNREKPDFVLLYEGEEGSEALDLLMPYGKKARRFRSAYEKTFGSMAKEGFESWDADKVLQMILSFYKTEAEAEGRSFPAIDN